MMLLLELREPRDSELVSWAELVFTDLNKLASPPAQKAAKNNAPQPFQSQLRYATPQIRKNTIATNLSFMLVALLFQLDIRLSN